MIGAYILTWAIVSLVLKMEKVRFDFLNIIFMYEKGLLWITTSHFRSGIRPGTNKF